MCSVCELVFLSLVPFLRLSFLVLVLLVSSRTALYDDVGDVTSFSALDVVEIKVLALLVVVVLLHVLLRMAVQNSLQLAKANYGKDEIERRRRSR